MHSFDDGFYDHCVDYDIYFPSYRHKNLTSGEYSASDILWEFLVRHNNSV
jgi:hypothetical protein